jgi:two-component system sensor histidine kinase RegB
MTPDELLRGVSAAFPSPGPLRIETDPSLRTTHLRVPRHAVEQALVALVRNALEASPADVPVQLFAMRSGGRGDTPVRFVVTDRGCGMSPESLRHAGEPFYTTKAPGKGMGLGIFLVRTLAEQLGGSLALESSSAGTSATLILPIARAVEAVAV